MNSGPEKVTEDDGEGTVTVVRHWGCEYRPGQVRWDPGYGSGIWVPYDENEARSDVARTPGARLVSRTETTIVVTTPWKEAEA